MFLLSCISIFYYLRLIKIIFFDKPNYFFLVFSEDHLVLVGMILTAFIMTVFVSPEFYE